MVSIQKASSTYYLYPLAVLVSITTILFVALNKERMAFSLAIVASVPLALVSLKRLVTNLSWGSMAIYAFLTFHIYFWASARVYFHVAFSAILFFLPVFVFEFLK